MTALEPLYTLAEAAAALQVTDRDVADPERWVRDTVRQLGLPYVRVVRTPKLPLSTIEALRAWMTRRGAPATPVKLDLKWERLSPSEKTAALIKRLEDDAAKRKAERRPTQ